MRKPLRIVLSAAVAFGRGLRYWSARRRRVAELVAVAGSPLDFAGLGRPARRQPMAVRRRA